MRRKFSPLQDERGEIASSLIIFLVAVGFFMLTVHATFIFHGNNVIKAAAQDALDAAQRAGADVSNPGPTMVTAGEAVGDDRLDLFPGLTDRSVEVSVDFSSDTVSVTVKARIVTPFLVDAGSDLETTIVGPIEQFYEQNERAG